jgi:hypothetical protein
VRQASLGFGEKKRWLKIYSRSSRGRVSITIVLLHVTSVLVVNPGIGQSAIHEIVDHEDTSLVVCAGASA